jgi:antitoxin component YwqK of YwqJK toxin-antitoxin module
MPKSRGDVRLRLSRVDFYRLRGQDFFDALFRCIDAALGKGTQRRKRWVQLNSPQQGLHAWWYFWGDVMNGGLVQYFYNHTDASVSVLQRLLKDTNNTTLAKQLADATAIYRRHKKDFAVGNPFGPDGVFARMTELTRLDRPVVGQLNRACTQIETWVRANIDRIAVGDNGEPIDAALSGEVETLYPNGQAWEQASVRRGRVSGAYRRFSEDGVLVHSCYYQGGKVCADYWPSGQPKHKTIKRGKLKVHEWYYPSGTLQKRLVEDGSGYAVEPVQLWHENGQLTEELHIRQGRKFGPWLKFFADGSPRLEAEHGKQESLVVKNAWDDQGRQVVKNGRGTYTEDPRHIDVSYELFFESGWIRSFTLRGGIPHGESTTWSYGVLWSKRQYANGKLDGECTTYYSNGRPRTRSTYREGREGKTENFPKFDHPMPAVLLKTEANEMLYTPWGEPLLTAYPEPRNLELVQAQLPMPAFLTDVFARNQAGTLREEYENLNTFDDNIAYRLTIDERGHVAQVAFSGASAYSGAVVRTYPPILRELRFEPGRIGKRKVRCQAIAWVHHTFVEGSPASST